MGVCVSGHILLVDISGFIHRAYWSGGAQYRSSDGLPTWAITGTMAMLWRLLGAAQADEPTHAAAVLDAPGPTFRNKLFPEYKNNRPARALELQAQIPWIRHVAEAMGMTPVEFAGFEADDVIATLATRAAASGMRATIVSSDKDLMQLVKDGAIEIVDPIQHVRIRENDVRNGRLGVEPRRVPDCQALAGDAVDNIPGIDRIGHKSAAMLIRHFGTVEGVVDAALGRNSLIPAGLRVNLRGSLETLQLYRTLATLRRDVPLGIGWDHLALKPIMREHIDTLLHRLEASGRFEAIFATEPKTQRVVERVSEENAFAWWKAELARSGQRVPDEPQCGFYRRRLVCGGVWVAARIWREDETDFVTGKPTDQQILLCTVDGKPRDAVQEWQALSRNPIRKFDFDYRSATAEWAKANAPDEPEAKPNEKINWNRCPL